MLRSIFSYFALFLFSITLVNAQSKINEQGVRYPTEEELAASKRMAERLRHPTLIRMRLLWYPKDPTQEQPTDTPPPIETGNFMDFRLIVSHTYPEHLVYWQFVDPYLDVRPELLKDGDIVSYTKVANENVERTENSVGTGSGAPSELLPGKEYEWSSVRLEEWYKPLGPGRYQLTIRRRFAWDGDWLESNPVIFEILPKEKNAGKSATKP